MEIPVIVWGLKDDSLLLVLPADESTFKEDISGMAECHLIE